MSRVKATRKRTSLTQPIKVVKLESLPYQIEHRLHRVCGQVHIPLTFVDDSGNVNDPVPAYRLFSLADFFDDYEWTIMRNQFEEYRINKFKAIFHPCFNQFDGSQAMIGPDPTYEVINNQERLQSYVGFMIQDQLRRFEPVVNSDFLRDPRVITCQSSQELVAEFKPMSQRLLYSLDGGKHCYIDSDQLGKVAGSEWLKLYNSRSDLGPCAVMHFGGFAGGLAWFPSSAAMRQAHYMIEMTVSVSYRRQL